jgi:hypothetical protein
LILVCLGASLCVAARRRSPAQGTCSRPRVAG